MVNDLKTQNQKLKSDNEQLTKDVGILKSHNTELENEAINLKPAKKEKDDESGDVVIQVTDVPFIKKQLAEKSQAELDERKKAKRKR